MVFRVVAEEARNLPAKREVNLVPDGGAVVRWRSREGGSFRPV